ncbi:MAG TPA: S9 family peptidase [Gammaproteobacteria bacterium]|nr:S9 family peptidase [Gammaproteobacteria bacterium]
MRPLFSAFVLAAALLASGLAPARADTHPFNAQDLVMMSRVSDPQLSPDGHLAAFTVRATDFAANKGATSIWTLALDKPGAVPRKIAPGNSPRFSPDGKTIYFLAPHDDRTQLWRVAATGGKAHLVSTLPVGINNYKLSPDGSHVLLSVDVFTDCPDLGCTRARLDARKADPATGRLYHRVFVRHWDTWMDGRRSQLFIAPLDSGKLGTPVWLTQGIDGDVPSKPFGGDAEYTFSPDGKTVYFDVRIAGKTEPWSTNFDIYAVPADGSAAPRALTAANKAWDAWPLASHDGKTLYYLAQKTPGFESDRFAIMAMNLATGAIREVDPGWDRSAGPLTLSADGKTLYTTADDWANHALFGVDVASGKVARLVTNGTVKGFAVAGQRLLVARQDFKHPTDLYVLNANSGSFQQVTHFNAERLSHISFGDYRFFTFKGWNGDTVQGYVMRPAGYVSGQSYPVAFLVHGGPQGAWLNDFHYRWNPEVYAGHGYAVVAINFHGSTGYGQAFTNAISQHWGDRPLVDLKKGWAAALMKFSFLDRDRACALGASYGGYMVYWMAGVWNQPWKCFVDHDGVFDMRMMYYATDELWFEEHENGGPEYLHPQNYQKFNPLNHVKDWRVPMLVVHSSHDYRIPISQGIGAFNALQRQGIPSEFLTFPDESHFVSKPHNSLEWHHVVLHWLDRWTKSGATAGN